MSPLARLSASAALALVLIGMPAVVSAGGALDDVREEVRDSSRDDDDRDDDRDDDWDDCDDDEE